MLKVGNEYQVEIIDLDYKGDGIALLEGIYTYIPGVLKDELVDIKIVAVKRGVAFGRLVKIVKPTKSRVNETSELGSLSLMHLSFDEQLKWQSKVTKETFDKVLKTDLKIEPIITDGVEFNYRNKVVFHVLPNSNKLKLGLYNVSNKTIEVNDFKLATLHANKIVQLINSANIEIDPRRLKHVVIKNNSNDEYLVTLVGHNRSFMGKEEIIELLQTDSKIKGVTLNIKDNLESILGSKTYVLYGVNMLKEGKLLITDQSFMQVNYGVSKLAFNEIAKNVTGNKIIDAYSGIGSIGYSILKDTRFITMIENNPANVELALKIKDDNKITNVQIMPGDAEVVITGLKADTLIVDPPRAGLKPSFIDEVVKEKPKRIIYLSCNLQTLVRDIRLISNEYEIAKVFPIKMFPQTNSFETLVILNKK